MATAPVERRDFLRTASAALLAPILGHPAWTRLAAIPSVPRASGNTKVLHIIGYAHIDAAWLWPWRDGADEALRTIQSATDRMTETPEFRYSHSSAAHYRWVEGADPQLFAIMKRRITDGRLEVINGWIVEPDCNIPATESVVRQSLYGKRYFADRFNVDVLVGANPDSFGHAAGLPQLLRRAGFKYYCFGRPNAHSEMPGSPNVFQWESPDGSQILTARTVGGYGADAAEVAELPKTWEERFQAGLDHAMCWVGIGDHGGGPTKEIIATVIALRKNPELPELRFSTLKDFFAAVEQSPGYAGLPVVKTELQHHARGCYAAHGPGKALNRRAERGLVEAETAAVVAHLAAAHRYDAADFAEAWWKVCFCQFHDMMAGSSISTDYVQVGDTVGWACEVAETRRVEALETLARRVDLSGIPTAALFVFNPLPWARTATVAIQTDRETEKEDERATHLIAPDGARIPFQRRPMPGNDGLWARLALPPCGYTVYTFGLGDTPPLPPAIPAGVTVRAAAVGLENINAPDGTPVLSAPAALVVVADPGDTWGHDINSWRQEIGRPTWELTEVIEPGPLARVTRQMSKWRDSQIIMDVEEYAGTDIVGLRFVIDWHEHAETLKLEFPTALEQPRVFTKVPGAAIERETMGDEEPMQDWVAVEGTIGGKPHALGVINAESYSYDCAEGLLRITLIRSAPFTDGDPSSPNASGADAPWQDQGRQERRFWLVRGAGTHAALGLERLAEEWQTPAAAVMDSHHPGTAPRHASYLNVEPGTVWVTAVKRSEDGDALIVRVQERAGTATEAVISSAAFGWRHAVRLGPWEIATLRVDAASSNAARLTRVTLLEKASV